MPCHIKDSALQLNIFGRGIFFPEQFYLNFWDHVCFTCLLLPGRSRPVSLLFSFLASPWSIWRPFSRKITIAGNWWQTNGKGKITDKQFTKVLVAYMRIRWRLERWWCDGQTRVLSHRAHERLSVNYEVGPETKQWSSSSLWCRRSRCIARCVLWELLVAELNKTLCMLCLGWLATTKKTFTKTFKYQFISQYMCMKMEQLW